MKHKYFSEHIDDVNVTIKEAVQRQMEAEKNRGDAQKRYDKVKNDPNVSAAAKTVAKEVLNRASSEYRHDMRVIQEETEFAFQALRRDLERDVIEFASADPGKVDQSTVMLLNSGAMRDSDLVSLANRFWGNPTMLKLIQAEAEKDLTDSKAARIVATAIAKHLSPKERLEIFDSAVNVAMYSIKREGTIADIHRKDWDNSYYPSLREAMAETESLRVGV